MENQTSEQGTSRRSFLKTSLLVGGGAAVLGAGAFGAKIASDYRTVGRQKLRPVAPEDIADKITFHGETFPDNTKKMFREGRLTGALEPERDVDVVIVGGGAGGLTAAYRLKDRDILLLEALPRIGGNSMYAEWEGIPYSLGGQYIGARGTWAESVWDLCDELGLSPEEDTSPLVVVFPGAMQLADPYSALSFLRMPLPWRVKLDMIRFFFVDIPNIDYEGRKQELDKIPFTELVKEYSPEFRKWYNEMAKEYPETQDASAYFAVRSLQENDYVSAKVASLPGGLGRINLSLAEKIEKAAPGRILTNAFAYKVKHDSEGRVLVTYWHDGKVTTVRAKAVIMNAEGCVARDILEDIPADLKEAMDGMRHFSYPVSHFCFREPIYQGGYRLGVMNCPQVRALTAQDWFSRGKGPERPNILSCFRMLKLSEVDVPLDKDAMTQAVAESLGQLDLHFPGTTEKLEAIQVWLRTRNFCVPYPGYVTEVFPKLGKPYGSIFFANAEYLNPITHFAEAVVAGTDAAKNAEKLLG